ncbi:PKD domain-containing protein, partial [bacterium]|nr:PKD domain-containing protein [bacterium]
MRLVHYMLILALSFCVLAAGCGWVSDRVASPVEGGAGGPSENAADQGAAWGAQGLPSLAEIAAELDGRKRESFTPVEGHRDGADFDPALFNSNVVPTPPSATYTPSYDPPQSVLTDLALAIYTFALPAYTGGPVALKLSWSDRPAQGDIFIGLGNWDKMTWQWFLPPADDSAAFPDLSPFIRNDDLCVAVVAVTGTGTFVLDELQFVVQQPPVADLQVDVDSGQPPLTVNFDAGGSHDPDSPITDFEWDLDGDGEFNEPGAEEAARGFSSTAFEYTDVGTYTVKVRVTDKTGDKDTAQREINVTQGQPPVADLLATPDAGNKPLAVSFDASGSIHPDGAIADFEWDFDGNGIFNETDNGEDLARGSSTPPAFIYINVGTYDVTVRVTDEDNDSDTAIAQINVTNTPPNADLQATPTSGPAPLSVDFDATGSTDPGGTITDYEWDFDGDGTYNGSGAEADARGNATPPTYQYALPGIYTPQVRVTDDDAAQDVAQATVVANNDPPSADLQADVTDGDPPLAVTFDASASSDPDGSISDFEWDFDGDGAFNEPGVEADARGSSTPVAYTYTDPGTFNAKVRVSDNFGITDTATLDIIVRGWAMITIDDPGLDPAAYSYLSFAVIGGHPAMAAWYSADSADHIRYMYSSTTTGSSESDWTVIEVPSVGNSGRELSLAEIGGSPAIASYDGFLTDLMYQRATNTGASADDWSASITIDDNNHTGRRPKLLEVSGNPAIFYRHNSESTVKYTRSTTPTGAAPGDWITPIDLAGPAGNATNTHGFAIINGNPAVLYYHWAKPNDTLHFQRSSTSTGEIDADWGTFFNLDTASGNGNWIHRLVEIDGNPAAIFQGGNYYFLHYFRATDTDGTAWGSVVTVDGSSSPSWMSLAQVGSNPAIAYQDNENDLIYVRSTTVDGGNAADWDNKETLEIH